MINNNLKCKSVCSQGWEWNQVARDKVTLIHLRTEEEVTPHHRGVVVTQLQG